MEERLIDKREQFRVNIRREHKRNSLQCRRRYLMELLDEQDAMRNEDSFIDLCHELIKGCLYEDRQIVEEVLPKLSEKRLLIMRPRILFEMKSLKMEEFLFEILQKEEQIGSRTAEYVLDVRDSVMQLVLELSITELADEQLSHPRHLKLMVDGLSNCLSESAAVADRLLLALGNLLSTCEVRRLAALEELDFESVLAELLERRGSSKDLNLCRLIIKFVILSKQAGRERKVKFLVRADLYIKEAYLSTKDVADNSILFELQEYLGSTLYNPHLELDSTIILQLFSAKRLHALQMLARISECQSITLSVLPIEEEVLEQLADEHIEPNVKAQLLRLYTNLLSNSELYADRACQVIELQTSLYYNTDNLWLRQQYAYLVQLVAQDRPDDAFFRGSTLIQDMLSDCMIDIPTKDALRRSLESWFDEQNEQGSRASESAGFLLI